MYNTAAHCGLYQQKPSSRICQHREEWACLQDRTKKCALCKCPIVLDTCVMQLCCIILTQRLCICSRMLFLHCYELMQPAANEVEATDMCRTERLELMWAFACELRQYITVTVCFCFLYAIWTNSASSGNNTIYIACHTGTYDRDQGVSAKLDLD